MKRFQWHGRMGQRAYKLSLTSLFIILMGIAVLLSLSGWQWHRSIEKKASLAAFSQDNRYALFPVSSPQAYQRVQLSGKYLNQLQFLLDNRFYQHRFGYELLTPFQIADQDRIILINRGFIPGQADRKRLPTIIPVKGRQDLKGRIYFPQANPFIRSQVIDNPGQSVLVIEKIDLALIAAQLGRPVYPYIIWLDPDQPHGFVRDWRLNSLSPQQHQIYAVQWFLLGVAWVLCWLIANSRRCDE